MSRVGYGGGGKRRSKKGDSRGTKGGGRVPSDLYTTGGLAPRRNQDKSYIDSLGASRNPKGWKKNSKRGNSRGTKGGGRVPSDLYTTGGLAPRRNQDHRSIGGERTEKGYSSSGNNFNKPSKISLSFNNKFSGKFGDVDQFNKPAQWGRTSQPFSIFKTKEVKNYENSEISFYNTDSLWSRWRRGYELYTATQSFLGSTASERSKRGDYRVYFTFQQYPGVFVPARIYTFPSANQELGEQIVGMRDTDAFSFYEHGLPILAVRYLGNVVSGTYNQSGTTLVIAKQDHGLYPGENVYLDIQSGGGVDETLTIVSTTQNTFTVVSSTSANVSGNLNYYLSTTFGDSRWTAIRVRIRYIPTDVTLFAGERLADRIIEKDPGISSTYTRSSSTVTVTCSSAHGLSTGNTVYLDISTGTVSSGRYTVTVLNTLNFQVTTIASGSTNGNLILSRLLRGRRYDDYVGYTVTSIDVSNNELVFQRKDSYGATTVDTITKTIVPAHRGFEVGRYLTTELRWQCSCQDFSRRDNYDLYSELTKKRFPTTSVRSIKPGQVLQKDGTYSDERDNPGTFRDLGFVTINNFYELPDYEDTSGFDTANLMYYQLRWCKHIYAAMFALKHDEGNDPINLTGAYTQSGANITIDAVGHNLEINTKIEITFTSGNAVSGEYTVTSVPTSDSFVVIYPFNNLTSGYCTISNLRKHDYVGAWLNEPSDKPIGEGLIHFERNFEKEKEKLESAVNLFLLANKSSSIWSGQKQIIDNSGQPESVANFDPSFISMTLTDNVKRDLDGKLSREGKVTNLTNRMVTLVNKLFNKVPNLLEDINFGIINKPLDEYTNKFKSGLVFGGTYTNGEINENLSNISIMDSSTYSPLSDQDNVVDADLYTTI